MKVRTRENNIFKTYEFCNFDDFYNWTIELIDSSESRHFKWFKNAKMNSDIVKNRFIMFYNDNKDAIVNTKDIANKCKTHNCNILSKDFYIEKGWCEEEAIKEISKIQKERSKTSMSKMTDDRIPTQIGYWIKKGYSEKDARDKLHERQMTFSREICIKKYGIDVGTRIFNDRQTRWQKTLISKYGIDTINKWKQSSLYSSKEAFNLFYPFYIEYKDKFSCYIGIDNSIREYFIRYDNNTYFYDFTIPKLRIIFEYNCEQFHPNPVWDKEKWNNWRQLHTGITADEYQKYYNKKIEAAENNGFKVIQLWSSSSIEYNTQIISSEIQAKLQTL